MALFIAKTIMLVACAELAASINNNDIKNQDGEYEVTQLGIELKPRHMAGINEPLKRSQDDEFLPMGRSLLEEQVYGLEVDATGSVVRRSLQTRYDAYDEVTATDGLYWSFAAYCWPDRRHALNIEDLNCRWCRKGTTLAPRPYVFRNDDHQGFVGVDKTNQRIVVSLRGTASRADLMANVLEGFETFQGVQVHEGYFGVWKLLKAVNIKEAIEAYMQQWQAYTVFITGHSLGGAVATLCAFDLALDHTHRQFVLYTFGSPHVGDEYFAAKFAKLSNVKSYRVVWGEDPVVNLPYISSGYVHVGTAIKYPNYPPSGQTESGPDDYPQMRQFETCKDGEDPKCASSGHISFGQISLSDDRYHDHYFNLIGLDETIHHVCQAKPN